MRSVVFLCAVIIGIEEWVGMEEFAEEKESWLQSFLPLPKGIKQYDTLSDVMGPNKGYSLYSGLSSSGFAEPIGTADWLGWQAVMGR